MSQVQIAKLVGISQQSYCRYERGAIPPFDIQARIAAILGSTPQDLFPPKEEAVAS